MKSRTAKPLLDSSIDEFERLHVRPKPGRTLIVGSQVYREKEDRRLRYPDVLGVDMLDGPGVDLVLDLEEPLPDDLGQFEHIECMSVLEHSRRPWLLAANVERLLAPGGTLYATVPFVWRIHGYPNDYWRVTPEGLRALFPGIVWDAVMLAGDKLIGESTKPKVVRTPHPFFPRTDVAGFGRKA